MWPLQLSEAKCEGCSARLDAEGHHRAACMRSGRVRIRAGPVERLVARICREAGARVQERVKLANLNVNVQRHDEREVGQQVAVDVTIRSVLTATGESRGTAHWKDGAIAEAARQDKERAYPEFALGSRCALVVLAVEAGGRFSKETCRFLKELASTRAGQAPRFLQRSVALSFQRRWRKMLGIGVAKAVAASLLLPKDELSCVPASGSRGAWLQDVLTEGRFELALPCATNAQAL